MNEVQTPQESPEPPGDGQIDGASERQIRNPWGHTLSVAEVVEFVRVMGGDLDKVCRVPLGDRYCGPQVV